MKEKIIFNTGFILVFVSLYFLLSEKIDYYKLLINNEIKVQKIKKNEEEKINIKDDLTNYEIEADDNKSEQFSAIIKIPSINLENVLVPINSPENAINQNIKTMEISTYPDIKSGNLILMAHSGTGRLAFFANLYKLNLNDEIYIYYNNKEYKYILSDIYTENKDGDVVIKRDRLKTTLTLITCTYKDKTSQTVYIAYLSE